MNSPVDVHPKLLDDNGIRRPIPPEGFALDNPDESFRLQVLAASATEHVLAEIRWAYLLSDEVRILYNTFDLREEVNSPVQRALQLQIHSSRKYTRITFPNCPGLKRHIHAILANHRCMRVGHDQLLDLHCTVSVPSLGLINEIHDFQ